MVNTVELLGDLQRLREQGYLSDALLRHAVRGLSRTDNFDWVGVYLLGARDATIKFADLYAGTRDADARANYEDLLNDLETNFAAKTRKLLLEDRTDMDIEIKVLRDRLQREGLRLD